MREHAEEQSRSQQAEKLNDQMPQPTAEDGGLSLQLHVIEPTDPIDFSAPRSSAGNDFPSQRSVTTLFYSPYTNEASDGELAIDIPGNGRRAQTAADDNTEENSLIELGRQLREARECKRQTSEAAERTAAYRAEYEQTLENIKMLEEKATSQKRILDASSEEQESLDKELDRLQKKLFESK